jgi:hypothetical protein
MILYCVICYLIMLGLIIEDGSNKTSDWWSIILLLMLAPLLIPIFIGMYLEKISKNSN